jgi:hypothetical protein
MAATVSVDNSKRRKRQYNLRPELPVQCVASKRLSAWMEKNDLDIAALSRLVGIPWETIKRLLEGRRRPSIDIAYALRDACDIALDDWMPAVKQRAA